jgi:hypothetical protein
MGWHTETLDNSCRLALICYRQEQGPLQDHDKTLEINMDKLHFVFSMKLLCSMVCTCIIIAEKNGSRFHFRTFFIFISQILNYLNIFIMTCYIMWPSRSELSYFTISEGSFSILHDTEILAGCIGKTKGYPMQETGEGRGCRFKRNIRLPFARAQREHHVYLLSRSVL